MCKYKKLLVALSLGVIAFSSYSDDTATSLVLMNNYDSRQSQDIWQRMRAGFKLEHKQTDRVKYYERLYTKSPKTFNRLMANARPYLYYLLTEVERYGMPSEIALIPGVESSFDPLAENPTDAYAGMWQFVPSTGRRFKMQQNGAIDERRDIVKSTRAALDYLNYLHSLFGQWEPAIGAYNWGEGNMYKAVANSGQPLGQVEYSDLELRTITADYVPKVIALASIIENPKKFGVNLDENNNQPYFAIVTPENGATVGEVEKVAGVDSKTFMKLNPQFKDADYVVSSDSRILLPLTNQSIYYASLGKAVVIQNELNNGPISQIDADEMADVAVSFQETKVEASAPLINAVATTTVVPSVSHTNSSAPVAAVSIESGLDELINTIANNDTGQAALVKVKSVATSNYVRYKVQPGDTLYSIARKYNVSAAVIKQQNNIPGTNLIVGQVLLIKTNSSNVT